MAKIKLPIETIRPNSEFFQQVTEAVMRGGKAEYKETDAIITLPDTRFFTNKDLEAVIAANGETYILGTAIEITRDEYNNSELPADVLQSLGIEEGTYHMSDLFGIVETSNIINDAGEDEQIEEESETEYVKVMLSYSNEWINGSIAKKIADFFGVDVEII